MKIINFFEIIGSILVKPIAVILQKILYSSSKKIFYKHNSSSSIHHRGSRIYDLGSHIFGQIKKRRFLVISTIVMSIGLTGLFFVYKNISKVEAGWWDDTWQYRKKITITSGSSATTNFQVKVQTDTSTLITANKMRSDCGDIRFTSSAGVELPYWVEETGGNACNDTDTNIWVKIDNVPAYGGTYIYMYYGNQSAKTGSNGDNTFEFFDDFMFKDRNKFSYGEAVEGFNPVSYEVMATGSGTLRIWSDVSWRILQMKKTFNPSSQIRIVTRFKTLGTANWHQNYLVEPGAVSTNRFGIQDDGTASRNLRVQYYVDGGGANYSSTIYTATVNTWYKDEVIKKNGTDFEAVIYDDSYSSLGNYTQSQSGWADESWEWVSWHNPNVNEIYDWIYIRKYLPTEPSASIGGEEQGTGPVAYYSFDEGQGTTVHNQAQINGENGLVAWWKFDDAASGTSPAPVDTMGTVYTASWQGNTTYSSTAKIGNAAIFDGTGDYIPVYSVPDAVFDQGWYGGFTISAWVRFDTVNRGAGYDNAIMGHGAASTYNGLHVGERYGKAYFGFYSNDISGTQSLSANTWYHLTFVYLNSRKYIYVNGILDGGGTSNEYTGTGSNLEIGRYPWSTNNDLDGYLDSVKLYNRGLSAGEVAAEYASTNGQMMNMTPASDWVDGAQQNPNQKPLGKALDFDGTDDEVIIPASSNIPDILDKDINMSVCAWIYPTSTPVDGRAIYGKNEPFHDADAMVYDSNNKVEIWYYTGGNEGVTSTNAAPLNTWTHVCMTQNGSTKENIIYLNAVNNGSFTRTKDVATSVDLRIGGITSGATNRHFPGTIDEVRVYSTTLTPDQVKRDYNRGVAAVLGAGQDASRGAPPVGWWKMDEGSGFSAFDSSGNNNTATMSATMTSTDWVPGKVGKGVDFDGTDDVIRVSANPTINNLAVKTIEAWVYPRTAGENSLGRILQKNYVSSGGFCASIDSNNKLIFQQIFSGSGATWKTNNNTLPLNRWTHIAITYDRTSTSNDPVMYIDGIPQTVFETVAPSGTITNEGAHVDLFIGNDQPAGTDRTWDGVIDNIKIYNYARTTDQIHYDMATGSPIAYWNFDEGTSTTAHNIQEKNSEYGLISWYKFDEGADNTCPGGVNDVCDTMGKNDGVSNSTAWATAGKTGNTMDFVPGSSNWVNLGNDASLQISLPITITAWIKPDDMSVYRGIFATDTTSGAYYGVWFQTTSGRSIQVNYGDGTGGGPSNRQSKTGANTLSTGKWAHVAAVVRDASDMDLYINGIDAGGSYNGTSTNAMAFSTAPARIGSDGTNYFDGYIDDVKVFNRSLNAEEINNIMNSKHGYLENMDPGSDWVEGARQNPNQKPMGKALDFDGSNDYVVATSAGTFDFSDNDDLTISAWIKRDSHDTDDTIIAKRNGVAAGDIGYLLRFTGADDKLYFEASDGTDEYSLQSNVTFTDTNWHHVLITFNQDSATDSNIYIDSKVDASATKTGTIGNIGSLASITNLMIGAESDGGSPYDGQIDEVKIYNFVLDSGEIKTEYNRGAAVVLGAGRSPSDTAGGNLVGWWKFDEGAGLSAFDSSGKNHTATASASYSDMWVNGKYGKAMNEYSNPNFCVGDNDDLDGTANLTVSFWVYRSSYIYWYERVLSKGWYNSTTGSFNGSWWFQMSGGASAYVGPNDQYSFFVNNGSSWNSATSAPVTTGWHHIVGSYDGTTIKIYVDGSLSGSQAHSGTIPNTWFALTFGYGSMPDCKTTVQNQLADGYLDEVKIWKKTLTPAEIAWEYNQGKPVYHFNFDQKEATIAANMEGKSVSNKGLVGFWTMDSTSVYDMSGNGNNLTATGSAAAVAGIKGNAIDFPASNFQQYYCTDGNCGADLDYQGNGFTVSAWVKPDNLVTTYHVIAHKAYYNSTTDNGGYALQAGNNAGGTTYSLVLMNSTGVANSTTFYSTTTEKTSQWQHVVGTYDGRLAKIYINGSLESASAYSGGIKNVNEKFGIGGDGQRGLYTFDGKIDHVKVWQRALTDKEVEIEAQYDEKYGYLHASMDPTTDWVSGKKNGALDFDGTDDYINVPNNIDDVQTVSLWINPTTSTQNILDLDGGTHYLTMSSGAITASGFSSPTIYVNNVVNGTIIASRWNHIVVTTATSFDASNLTIGKRSTNYFSGQMDEVKIFNYALTSNQVKLDYNFGAAARF